MKTSIKFLLLSVLILSIVLSMGCARINRATGGTEVSKAGSQIQVVSNKSNPPGEYVLETTNGAFISKASLEYTPSNSFLRFRPDYTQVDREIASQCLRIRTPENKFMPIGFSGDTEFLVPSLETDAIRSHEIPKLQRHISSYDRHQQQKARAYQWLVSHPTLYDGGQCVRPDIGPQLEMACPSPAEVTEYCMESNLGCGSLGAFAEGILGQGGNASLSEYAELAGVLASTGCGHAYDSHVGQSFSWASFLRSLAVTAITGKMVDEYLEDHPAIERAAYKAAIAGSVNFYFCKMEKNNECQNRRRAIIVRNNKAYESCVKTKQVYDSSSNALSSHGKTKEELETQLRELEARIKPQPPSRFTPLNILQSYKNSFDRLRGGVTSCP